ncbi:MAG: FAD-dependent oxidoreductase [Paramuribaculum sp.]|nr:FAD-dependent oxidoreductase [Paramuribaculum sp.]
MKRIVIIGAGVTGLSLAQQLRDSAEVIVLEKESTPGGIAKTKQVNGSAYHLVGGHCFNSKYPEVMGFVFSQLPQHNWHKTTRLSKINFGEYEVNYPLEFSVKEIFKNDPEFAFSATSDFLKAEDTGKYSSLSDWFRQKFGETFCRKYFIPYNTKIWGKNPDEMDYKWVSDKLPIPDKKAFFKSLLENETDTMPHSSFYYPNSNDQKSLIETLSQGLDIKTDYQVTSIEKRNNKWIVNGEIEADILVSTIPLNLLPKLIKDTPEEVVEYAGQLKYNKVSNVLWESQPTNKTWTYQPNPDTIFHRYIHIGSFFQPVKNLTITECVGEHSYEEMVENGRKDPFLIKPLDYNVSEHAYVVYDEKRDKAVEVITDYLNNIGIYSIGRFGRWEYYNMDICMLDSINTAKIIKENL